MLSKTRTQNILLFDLHLAYLKTSGPTEKCQIGAGAEKRRLISGKILKAIDCKVDTTGKTFRDTITTRTDKAGSQLWTAVSLLLELVSTV